MKKTEVGRVREEKRRRKKIREEKESEERRCTCAKRSRNTLFFQCFGASEGRKSRLAKAAGAEPAGQMRDEKMHAVVARSTSGSQNAERISVSERFWKWTPLWREAHFEINMYETPGVRSSFGSCDVEKVYGVVARSTFGSKKC